MSKKQEAIERPLPERVARARREGRTQQALDLARQLFKQNQNEENRELVRQVTLERGKQLQAEGKIKDAATVFSNLLTMGGTAELRGEASRRLAECGAAPQAMAAMAQIDDPALRQRLLQQAADAAIAKGAAGKSTLPADLHADFEHTLTAFRHYDAGRDDDARAVLQSIGLQSPFLEWKLLLRGLLAYYARDDARALENWRRLDAGRLPHRLCMALRAGIDPAFLKAQPTALQKQLREKIAEYTLGPMAEGLRVLAFSIRHDNLGPAFRNAQPIVQSLRRDFPQLVPRLAHCFFWAVVDHGQPEDCDRYYHLFCRPESDVDFYRLQALSLEDRGLWPEAHNAWQNVIDRIADLHQEWPGEIGTRARAIVWSHLAENALPQRRRKGRSGNPFFDLFASQVDPLKPSAEECYEKAIALAPDRLASYTPLLRLYRQEGKLAKAKTLGKQMLERFPNHADTLEALGELCLQTKDYERAREYFEKSIQANPLDLALRGKLARARQNLGLHLALEERYDAAREQYQKALELAGNANMPILAQWAAVEFKAGDAARAQELIERGLAGPDHRLAFRYALLGASVRIKLPAKEKKRVAADLKSAFAFAPTPAEILVLLESAAAQREIHDEAFHGQKTQEKTILKFLSDIDFAAFDEGRLERLAAGLETLNVRKPWRRCLSIAGRRFPRNPSFRLSLADFYLTERNSNPNLAQEYIDQARELVEQLPRGEQQERFLDEIREKEAIANEIRARSAPNMDVLGEILSRMGDIDSDDADDDEGFW